ncbi:SlyX family protein [Rubinisphaera italica]|uniref:Protein SlyX n=1 Tax=Rubinisphaera italica TaxID=2527969 RepID=A0A5C5XJK8_9PLAN|nr:SlyX family protein [Rubinisphaera italica]TWT62295.1 Protein SlyX [Rubinisphaera italica]
MTQDQDSSLERIVSLESLVTHLQYDLEQISKVVHSQQQKIDDLQRQIDLWVEQSESDGFELPDPLQEKPPHY